MPMKFIKSMESTIKCRVLEVNIVIKTQVIKALIVWIAIALVWSALELIWYGEVHPRIVDDIMWILWLPFIYDAMRWR